jgi:hypothetical protein
MATLRHEGQTMINAIPELPAGAALERQIAEIEARTDDDRFQRTVAERIARANGPNAVFVAHAEVFAESRARLMRKLATQGDA